MERGTGKIVLSVFRIDSAELTPETRLPIGSLELSSDKPEFTFGRKHPPLETCKSLSAKALHLKLTKDNKIEVTRLGKNQVRLVDQENTVLSEVKSKETVTMDPKQKLIIQILPSLTIEIIYDTPKDTHGSESPPNDDTRGRTRRTLPTLHSRSSGAEVDADDEKQVKAQRNKGGTSIEPATGDDESDDEILGEDTSVSESPPYDDHSTSLPARTTRGTLRKASSAAKVKVTEGEKKRNLKKRKLETSNADDLDVPTDGRRDAKHSEDVSETKRKRAKVASDDETMQKEEFKIPTEPPTRRASPRKAAATTPQQPTAAQPVVEPQRRLLDPQAVLEYVTRLIDELTLDEEKLVKQNARPEQLNAVRVQIAQLTGLSKFLPFMVTIADAREWIEKLIGPHMEVIRTTLLALMEAPYDYVKDFAQKNSSDFKASFQKLKHRVVELTLDKMPDAEACKTMWSEMEKSKGGMKQIRDGIKNAQSQQKLHPLPAEGGSRAMIKNVLTAIAMLSPEDKFKCRILSSVPANNKGESSIDYVILAALRPKVGNIPESEPTPVSSLDCNQVFGGGEAKRLLVSNKNGVKQLKAKIEKSTKAPYNEFTLSSNGTSTSGDLACAFGQCASFSLEVHNKSKDRRDLAFFISDGILWRFVVFTSDKLYMSRFFLLRHEELVDVKTVDEDEEQIIQFLAYMLHSATLKASAAARQEFVGHIPGVRILARPDPFSVVTHDGRRMQLDITHILGRGSQRTAFAVRQYDYPQLSLCLIKIDIPGANECAVWQSDREIEVLQQLAGRPGIPHLLAWGEVEPGRKFLLTDIIGITLDEYVVLHPSKSLEVYKKGRLVLESFWRSGYVLSDINGATMVVDADENVWIADLGGCYRIDSPPAFKNRVVTYSHASYNVIRGLPSTPDDDLEAFDFIFNGFLPPEGDQPQSSSIAAF